MVVGEAPLLMGVEVSGLWATQGYRLHLLPGAAIIPKVQEVLWALGLRPRTFRGAWLGLVSPSPPSLVGCWGGLG